MSPEITLIPLISAISPVPLLRTNIRDSRKRKPIKSGDQVLSLTYKTHSLIESAYVKLQDIFRRGKVGHVYQERIPQG